MSELVPAHVACSKLRPEQATAEALRRVSMNPPVVFEVYAAGGAVFPFGKQPRWKYLPYRLIFELLTTVVVISRLGTGNCNVYRYTAIHLEPMISSYPRPK